ncbi:MAG: DEAD/DEAH box helicase [Candidatus Margulisiibacteriota bacterium]
MQTTNTIYLLIEPGPFSKFKVIVLENRKRLSPFSTEIPSELRALAKKAFSYGAVDAELVAYFQDAESPLPMLILHQGQEQILTFDPAFKVHQKTSLSATESGVVISRLGVDDQGHFGAYHVLGQSLVLDFERGRVGILEESTGWGPWAQARAEMGGKEAAGGFLMPIDAPITLNHAEFSDMTFLADAQENLLFFSQGEPQVPLQIESPSYRVRLMKQQDTDYAVHLEAWCPGHDALSQDRRLVPLLTELPLSVRVRRRMAAFISWFCEHQDGASEDEVLSYFAQDPMLKDFSRHVLAHAKQVLAYTDQRQPRYAYSNGQWCAISGDLAREKAVYRILLSVLGEELFLDRFVIQKELLWPLISALKQALMAEGFDVYFGKELVEVVSWDFVIDVQTGDDWFELHPQILSQGQRLTPEQWQAVLAAARSGEEGGPFLDPKTQHIVELLKQWMMPSSDKARQVHSVVKVPRLQILDWLYLRKAGVTLNLPKAEEEMLDRLVGFQSVPSRDVPEGFKGELRSYQRAGYEWLSFLYEYRFGGCLADDMGLGKTIQTIVFLAAVKEQLIAKSKRLQPSLVVVPPSLLFNWHQEIGRFYPSLRVLEYTGADRKVDFEAVDVVLTTYDVVRRDIDQLSTQSFEVIIFDEAQIIKNIFAERTASVRRLSARFKVCLTGTPLENHLGEYFSILDLALPGLFGDYSDFQEAVKNNETQPLIARSRPFVLRRTKEAIQRDLPPKTEQVLYLELSDAQKTVYTAVVNQVRSTVAEAFKTHTASQARIIALTAILRLRQICIAPQLVDKEASDLSPKFSYLLQTLKELQDEGHSALIFTQFTSCLDLLEPLMTAQNMPFLRMDGKTPTAKRKQLVESFQNSETPQHFLLSLKTGGVGLNLTRASYVFHLDPWWNPAVENQASDRAHRLGQTQHVFVTKLVMRHTVEEKMMQLKAKKQALFESVLNNGVGDKALGAISKEDLAFLIGA